MFTGIYEDIAKRTNGDIYAGIVGPVRTGKSTFISKFMELLVIPNIENRYKKERAIDELPQSAGGKSIMTCEPKFVPNEAVELKLNDEASSRIRLIDCVGYIVEGALGAYEDGSVRMVKTPWSKDDMPFGLAAEIGTKKVISEHSTIGILVTTDGSITDLPRECYVPAEERVVSELKKIKKPFTVVLNSKYPESENVQKLKNELAEKYSVSVTVIDVLNMGLSDIERILSDVLYEFPVSEITYSIPNWVKNLSEEHWLNTQIEDFIVSGCARNDRLSSVSGFIASNVCESFDAQINEISLSTGKIASSIHIDNSVFYKIMSEENDISVKNESDLFVILTALLKEKKYVSMLSYATREANNTGYGIVYPEFDKLDLQTPEIFNDSGKYGISLKANAQAFHIIKANIDSEISPVIGSEAECEMFFDKLITQYKNTPSELWNTEIFGRKLSEMIEDNIKNKLNSINDETKQRVSKAVNRVSNAQKGGLFIFWI